MQKIKKQPSNSLLCCVNPKKNKHKPSSIALAARYASSRKPNSTLHPPPQLRAHGLPRVFSAECRLLVLGRSADQEIQALGHGAPRQQLDDPRLTVRLHGWILHEALADLVCHALQLRVRQSRQVLWGRGEHLRCADCFCSLDGG